MQMTKAFGSILLDACANRTHDLEVDAEQIVAAHAGLARHTGSDDDDISACNVGVGIGPGQFGVKTIDGRGFGEIERFALRCAFGNVEQDDIAKLLEPREVGERAADLTSTNQCDFLTRHHLSPINCGRAGLIRAL